MRKAFIILSGVCILSLIVVSSASCDDALKKLGRGVANVATCVLEVPEQMGRINDSDGPLAGVTFGLFKGIGMLCVRAVVGVYEVATFPLPFPKAYQPILKDPEFFFEDKIW